MVIKEMQQNVDDVDELLYLNQTFIIFMGRLQRLKQYEKEKNGIMGVVQNNQIAAQDAKAYIGPSSAMKVETIPKKDYLEYLKKVEDVTGDNKDDLIKQSIKEIKEHQLQRIQQFESL